MEKNVLIVEDERVLAEMYQAKLELEGFRVELAYTGKEALGKMVDGFIPDLILLDILMPDLNGLDVLKEMKKESFFRKIPVIMLTNLGEAKIDMNRELSYALGVKEYLIKSRHTPEEVVEKIKQILEI